MENTKRKVPVWAIILYAVTGLLLLAGVALIIFSAIDSATLLPYKRQNISEYFSDETHYYTVAGTVEELSVGTLADGAYHIFHNTTYLSYFHAIILIIYYLKISCKFFLQNSSFFS